MEFITLSIVNAGGMPSKDCISIIASRALSDALDKDDFIDEAYIMEVSSPGLGRTLKKDRHLEYSIGEEVEIKLYKPVDGCKDFEGTLKFFDKDNIVISVEEEEKSFARKDIAIIRLKLDI